jgi:hypothetical protein
VQYQSQRTRLIWISFAAACFFAAPDVFAHHSTAPYDLIRETIIEGTATTFDFVNPHGNIELDVHDASGKVEHWTVAIESPVFLRRKGWSGNTLKSGDKITVTGNRARDGSFHLRGISVQLPDGRKLVALQV